MLKLSHPSVQALRGFAGAVLFSFPMLMTMEMWSLGVALEPERLMLFVTVHLALLVGLASFARDDALVPPRRAISSMLSRRTALERWQPRPCFCCSV